MAASDRNCLQELDDDLAAAGTRFVAAVEDLAVLANDIARLAAQRSALEGRLGIFRRPGPSELELASRVVLGHLGALRPNLPFETTAGALAAGAMLCRKRSSGTTTP